MMYPPVAATLIASSAAKALIGSNPVRVYAAGEAPQPPTLPYVTWQTISGIPENYLGAAPDMDGYIAQVDVWAGSVDSMRATAAAVAGALEAVGHVTAWNGESRDPDTKNFRFSFTVEFLTPR